MSPRRETFFASCPPGFERVLLEEARALKLPKPEAQYGGVQFPGTMVEAARANLWLRTAGRVLLRLARFPAATSDQLYEGVRKIKWERFVDAEGTLAVSARGKNPGLTNSHFVERRVKDAIVDQFRDATGKRPSVDLEDPDLNVTCRIAGDRATILADTSGMPLFKRGWRRSRGIAPLKETLAAFMVLASGWDGRSPLLDPFCGSGTILIEAAMIAGNHAPGLLRERFGFERWPEHRAAPIAKLREEARAAVSMPRRVILIGSDNDAKAVAAAQENIEAAGLADRIVIEHANVTNFAPKKGWNAFIVTNPPYGERMGKADKLRGLFREFGETLRRDACGYRVTILVGHPALKKALGFTPEVTREVRNGPLECELLTFGVP